MEPAGGAQSDALLQAVVKTKRETVPVACDNCRKRKQKCDGQRPCERCIQSGAVCVFESAENETPRDTRKRKFENMKNKNDDLERENAEYRRLVDHLLNASDDDRTETLQQLRDKRNVGAVVASLQGPEATAIPAETVFSCGSYDLFLTLLQSTCTLDDLNNLRSSIASAGHAFHNPSPNTHFRLREGIVKLRHLQFFFEPTNTDHSSPHFQDVATDRSYLISFPNFVVPASPWLSDYVVTDEVVSRLVSLYLNHLNTYWRVIEDDLFLRGMRSRRAIGPYCSALLVNAILSYASEFFEREETPTESLERGMTFHTRALRLWESEKDIANFTNIQAAVILALSCLRRGNDRQGREFANSATALLKVLSQSIPVVQTTDQGSLEHIRLLSTLRAAIFHLDATLGPGFLRPCNEESASLAAVSSIREDTLNLGISWSAYPLQRNAVAFYPTLLQHYLHGLNRLFFDLDAVLTAQARRHNSEDFWSESKSLSRRLFPWFYSLPEPLRYTHEMPIPVFELHCQYYCLQMQLSDLTFLTLTRGSARNPGLQRTNVRPDVQADLTRDGIFYARQAATAARDYRDAYGLKIIVPYLLQSSAHAAMILLRYMRPGHDASILKDIETTEDDINKAFTECFRVILTSSMQCTLGKGLLRMILADAQAMRASLPPSVQEIVAATSSYVWHPQNLGWIHSSFPNWALMWETHADPQDFEMDTFIRRWCPDEGRDSAEEIEYKRDQS